MSLSRFRKGVIDALPVFVGYVSVGFTFGLAAATAWGSSAIPVLASLAQFSGAGQFMLLTLVQSGSTVATIAIGVAVINFRYAPMAIAIAQRLDPAIPRWKLLIVAMCDTDEQVGISLRQTPPLKFDYLAGLLACSLSGWVGGTVLGANPATRHLLSPRMISALGMALPAMFAAIVFPAFRESRRIAVAVAVATAASFILRALPARMDPGWVTLAAGVGAAAIAAAMFPMPAQGASGKEQ